MAAVDIVQHWGEIKELNEKSSQFNYHLVDGGRLQWCWWCSAAGWRLQVRRIQVWSTNYDDNLLENGDATLHAVSNALFTLWRHLWLYSHHHRQAVRLDLFRKTNDFYFQNTVICLFTSSVWTLTHHLTIFSVYCRWPRGLCCLICSLWHETRHHHRHSWFVSSSFSV